MPQYQNSENLGESNSSDRPLVKKKLGLPECLYCLLAMFSAWFSLILLESHVGIAKFILGAGEVVSSIIAAVEFLVSVVIAFVLTILLSKVSSPVVKTFFLLCTCVPYALMIYICMRAMA